MGEASTPLPAITPFAAISAGSCKLGMQRLALAGAFRLTRLMHHCCSAGFRADSHDKNLAF